MSEHLFDSIVARKEALFALRRDLHQHPELAFHEERTGSVIARRLKGAGIEVRTGLARTGLAGVLRGDRPGPTVLVRADIDALPIHEDNEVPYRSRIPGVMHA